jgi:hypothetical protein
MEYVRGSTLDQHAKQGTIPVRKVASLLARAARALAVAHQRGIIHLDIKPRNILIDEAGQPRVIDFGLARIHHAWTEDSTSTGSISGSVPYMAPEQARGETDQLGPRTDIFALGGVLYFLLLKQPLYPGRNLREVLDKAQRCVWDRSKLHGANVSRQLKAICIRALSANPNDRYPRMEDLAHDLEKCSRGPQVILWSLAAAAVLLFVMIAAAYKSGFWSPEKKGETAGAVGPDVAVSRASASSMQLAIRVWRKGRYCDLVDVVPLHAGDELQIRTDVPADLFATLFLLTSEGRLKKLAELGREKLPRSLRYPQEEEKSVPLIGPPGTEFLIVCGRRSDPIGVGELNGLGIGVEAWPHLPEGAILRLGRDRITADGEKSRDVGTPKDRPDPEREVHQKLESLRKKLAGRFEYLTGVAFAHQ